MALAVMAKTGPALNQTTTIIPKEWSGMPNTLPTFARQFHSHQTFNNDDHQAVF